MKVTYQTCCGVDVHKRFLVATIVKTTGGIEPSYQKKRFSTFNNSILEFKQWLLDNNCRDVCMESTGKYWVLILSILVYTFFTRMFDLMLLLVVKYSIAAA